jgi:hypothetical protein
VPPPGIRCAATRYKVCRHKVKSVPPQGTKCAATRYQLCRHKVSGVPPPGISCAATRYQACRQKVLGIPPPGIRCASTRYQVCREILQEILYSQVTVIKSQYVKLNFKCLLFCGVMPCVFDKLGCAAGEMMLRFSGIVR